MSKRWTERLDEVWAGEYVLDEGESVLHRRLFQPNRSEILENVKRIRTEGLMPHDTVLGRPMVAIPLNDWEALGRSVKWCELHSTDFETSQRAMRRFMQHPDSAPYRLVERAS